ncbi:MAG TPA: hypothetical protein VJP40_09580, partial [bacterium]|nr:hypothetical protein [bacterium]
MEGSGHIHPSPSSSGLGWSVLLGSDSAPAHPAAALDRAIRGRLPAPPDPTLHLELLGLARESDPGLWAQGLLGLADRWQRRGNAEVAQVLWEQLAVPGAVPEDLSATVDLARRRLEAIRGGGRAGDRAEFVLDGFWQGASDPYGLLGFAAGGTVFKLSRAVFTSRLLGCSAGLWTRGWGARSLAQAGAFGLEVPAFVLSAKAARQWGEGSQDWNPQTLGHELYSTGLTLFFLKAAGGLSQAAWGMRPVPAAFQQAALYGGILLGQRAEGQVDPVLALATLLQFNVAGRMTDGILGAAYRRAMEGLEFRRRTLDREGLGQRPQELIPNYVLNSASGDGKGPGDRGRPKIIELFPMAHEGKVRPTESKPIEPGLSLSRARTLVHTIQEDYARLLEILATFRAAAEIQAGLKEKNRGDESVKQELQTILAQHGPEFRERLAQGMGNLAELRELHFITAGQPALHKLAQSTRGKLLALHKSASDLEAGFEILKKGLESGKIHDTLKALAGWCSLFPEGTWPWVVLPIDFVSNPVHGMKIARLAGMMYGVAAKDVLRVQHRTDLHRPSLGLDPRSPRAEDGAEAYHLLGDLLKAGSLDYSEVLLRPLSPHSLLQPPLPRESLRHLGTYEDPFRSWFSLHLPALLVSHRGRSAEVLEKIKAVELFMTAEARQANRLILDWLSMALDRKGHPRDWAAELPEFEGGGPLEIFSRAADAFVRHSSDPGLALRAAMAAPPPIREDVVSLTGALVGAYLGRSAFSGAWLLPSVYRAFPGRQINPKLETSWLLNSGHMEFENATRLVFENHELPRIRPHAAVKDVATQNPVWLAFLRGLSGREDRLDDLLSDTMRIAAQFVAADPAAVQVQHYFQFHAFLGREMRRIYPMLRNLHDYVATTRERLAEVGVPGEPQYWSEIEGRLLRFDEAFMAYVRLFSTVKLSVDQIGYFTTAEQARAKYKERIQEFDQVLGVPDRRDAIRGDWVRRFSGTMDIAAKKQKILDLVMGRAEAKARKVARRDLREFESIVSVCPEYLLSDLAYWAESDSLLAKAWLRRLRLLPKGSPLWTDPEVSEALQGTVGRLRSSEGEEIKMGIFYHYTIQGSRLLPEKYRSLGSSERTQWADKIDQLPPILARSLLESG